MTEPPAAAGEPLFVPMPGLEVVRLGSERALLRTETVSLTLEGPSVAFFVDRVLPLLDGERALADVAKAAAVAPAELTTHLTDLAAAGVLRRVDGQPPADHPLAPLLATLGLAPERAAARLAAVRVAIFGLEGVGGHLARELLRAGVGTLALHDPFPLAAGDRALLPFAAGAEPGTPRQQVAAAALAALASRDQRIRLGAATLERDQVRAEADQADLLVGAFDRGFIAAHHWINRAAMDTGVPALFTAVAGTRATVGPFVIPHETACFMCWRMRELATADDFATAMAYEEHLDGRRQPAQATRPTLASLATLAAGLAATEILKVLLALGTPTLTGQVAHFEMLSGQLVRHPVLFRPDCPVCQKKNT